MEPSNINALAAFVRPFLLLALMIAIVLPIKWAIHKLMPDGKLKRILFRRFD